jgi:hypothetical protein
VFICVLSTWFLYFLILCSIFCLFLTLFLLVIFIRSTENWKSIAFYAQLQIILLAMGLKVHASIIPEQNSKPYYWENQEENSTTSKNFKVVVFPSNFWFKKFKVIVFPSNLWILFFKVVVFRPIFEIQSNLALRNCLIRNKLVLRNHFPWPICNLLHKDKEHLALRNNFRVTKEFLITKFDCSIFHTYTYYI